MKKTTILQWYRDLQPGLSLRELWREFYSFCRWHRLGDIHTQGKALRFMTKLFGWELVQLIREDFGEDHLKMSLKRRLKNYKQMKKMFPAKNYQEIIGRFLNVK